MAFPDAPRVIYGVNPLDEVVCQVRFPPILRIDAEPPAAFQELVRRDLPFYAVEPSQKINLTVPKTPTGGYPNALSANLLAGTGKHGFASADRTWKLSLSRDSLVIGFIGGHDLA